MSVKSVNRFIIIALSQYLSAAEMGMVYPGQINGCPISGLYMFYGLIMSL
jgi:hypothetical protein